MAKNKFKKPANKMTAKVSAMVKADVAKAMANTQAAQMSQASVPDPTQQAGPSPDAGAAPAGAGAAMAAPMSPDAQMKGRYGQ